MVKKRQMNIRVSNLTARQILRLQKRLNVSKTELVTLAIDRLYREETKRKSTDELSQE